MKVHACENAEGFFIYDNSPFTPRLGDHEIVDAIKHGLVFRRKKDKKSYFRLIVEKNIWYKEEAYSKAGRTFLKVQKSSQSHQSSISFSSIRHTHDQSLDQFINIARAAKYSHTQGFDSAKKVLKALEQVSKLDLNVTDYDKCLQFVLCGNPDIIPFGRFLKCKCEENSMIDFYDQKACMHGYELTKADAPLGSLEKKFLNLKKKNKCKQ